MFDSTIERYFGASRYKRGLVPALLLLLVLICSVCVNAQDSPGVHIVQPGETLWSISRQYGLDVETLALVNDLSNPNSIRVGQKLIVSVSQSVEYTVQRGDSLWAISAAFGVSVDDIARVNRITNPSKIKAGQVLTIPLGVGGVGV
ncbi:MAG: LysM peptidoglycan-binding domain-containing protein, partial [Bacillota bacterium]